MKTSVGIGIDKIVGSDDVVLVRDWYGKVGGQGKIIAALKEKDLHSLDLSGDNKYYITLHPNSTGAAVCTVNVETVASEYTSVEISAADSCASFILKDGGQTFFALRPNMKILLSAGRFLMDEQ